MKPGSPPAPDTNQEIEHPRSRIKLETVWSIARPAGIGIIVIIAIIILALKWPVTRNAILVFLLSVGLAYVIAPLANRMRPPSPIRGKQLTPVSSLLFIYLLLILIGTMAWMVAGERLQREVTDLQAKLPAYADQARQRLEMLERFADRIPLTEPLASYVRSFAVGASALIQTHALRVGQEMAASRPVLSWLWLVPAISLLLISRVGWFEHSAVLHLPEGHMRWRGEEFFQQVNSILAGYTRAQFLSCGIITMLSLAGFWIIGVPYAPLMGLISGALEVLPIVGPLTVAIATCTIVDGDRLFILIGFLAAMRLAQDYIIYPRLVGHHMHLHPVAIVCVILAGGITGGMLGVLAAIPLVGVASVAIRHWREYWELEKLVREQGRSSAGGVPTEPSGGAGEI